MTEFEKKVPHRGYCCLCYHPVTVNFWVPDEIWFEAVPKFANNSILCLNCLIRLADEKMLPWDKEIKLLPVSMYSQLQIQRDVEKGVYNNPETEHVWHCRNNSVKNQNHEAVKV